MPDHAFGDRCLGDLDPKLEKIATIWSPTPSPASDKAEIFHELRRPSVVRHRPVPLQTVLKPRLTLDVALVVSVPVQLHRASPDPAYTRMGRFVTEAWSSCHDGYAFRLRLCGSQWSCQRWYHLPARARPSYCVFFGQDNQQLNLTVRPRFVITLSFKTIGGNNGYA